MVMGGQKLFNCNQFPPGIWQWFPSGKEWVTKPPTGMSAPILSVPCTIVRAHRASTYTISYHVFVPSYTKSFSYLFILPFQTLS